LETLADLDTGAVERHDPLHRRRPLRPSLDVGEDVPDGGGGGVDLDTAVHNHVPNGTGPLGTPRRKMSRRLSDWRPGERAADSFVSSHGRFPLQPGGTGEKRAGDPGPTVRARCDNDAMTQAGARPDWRVVDEGWGRRAVDFSALSEPANCREYVA